MIDTEIKSDDQVLADLESTYKTEKKPNTGEKTKGKNKHPKFPPLIVSPPAPAPVAVEESFLEYVAPQEMPLTTQYQSVVEQLKHAIGDVTYNLDDATAYAFVAFNLLNSQGLGVGFSKSYTQIQIELLKICAIYNLRHGLNLVLYPQDLNQAYQTIWNISFVQNVYFNYPAIIDSLENERMTTSQVLESAGIHFGN